MYKLINRQTSQALTDMAHFWDHLRLLPWNKYSEEDYQELVALRQLYLRYCVDKDKEPDPLLDIDEEKKRPKAGQHEIQAAFQFNRNATGFLTCYMVAFFNELVTWANARIGANIKYAKKNQKGIDYADSASIIFCAELAKWTYTNALIGEPDEKLIADCKVRVDYLLALEASHLFKHQGDRTYSIPRLLFNLRILLEDTIIPISEARMSQRASRDFFDTLYQKSILSLDELAKAFLSLFTAHSQMPEKFSLVTHSESLDKHYLTAIRTPLGQKFIELKRIYQGSINHNDADLFQQIQKNKPLSLDVLYRDLKKSGVHKIIYQYQEMIQKLDAEILTLDEGSDDYSFDISQTIIPSESYNTKMLDWLSEALHQLTNFCYVIKAIEKAFSLAGLGGDILIYMGLAAETQQVLACVEQNIAQIEKVVSITRQECNQVIYFIYDANLINTDKNEKETYKDWKQINYHRFREHIHTVKLAFYECKQTINHIRTAMNKVQSRDYQDEVNRKVQNFKKMVALLTKSTQLASALTTEGQTNTPSLPDNTENFNINAAFFNPPHANSLTRTRENALVPSHLSTDVEDELDKRFDAVVGSKT